MRDEFEEDTLEVKRCNRVKELVASTSEKTVEREKRDGRGGKNGTRKRTGVWEWCAVFGPR